MKQFTYFIYICFFFCYPVQAQIFSADSKTSCSISFKENKGQISDQFYQPRPDILFSGSDGELAFYLKKGGISYQIQRTDTWETDEANTHTHLRYKTPQRKIPSQISIYRIDVDWVHANKDAQIKTGDALDGFENYYSETCPQGALYVKKYKEVVYKTIYEGIDLKWHTDKGVLKYDYYVEAYADYTQIQLEYKGADKIHVNKNGELIIKTPLGTIAEPPPLVLQQNKKLEASWQVNNKTVSFNIKNIDPSKSFVIDPLVRLWGTYFGGVNNDQAYIIETDNMGNVYLTGDSRSLANIATTGAHQTVYGGTNSHWGDAFVSKFNPSGVLLWSTYYGGAQADFGNYCTVDANGNVFLVGGTSTTNSAVMATPGAHQSIAPTPVTNGSVNDAFLVKFNSSGVRQWGTYYGGTSYEWAYYVDINPAGDILMSGTTRSTDANSIATPGCHQSVFAGGGTDGFIVLFNSAGVRQWGTYYGGSGGSSTTQDDLSWCKFGNAGDFYICGGTRSNNGMSTPGAHQFSYGGGNYDGFMAKFDITGQRLWASYYGGSGDEYMVSGSLDGAGNIYFIGYTTTGTSSVMTTPGCHQPVYGGTRDVFLVKFDTAGIRQWGTYYGGSGIEYAMNNSIDPFGNIYFGGTTSTSAGTAVATPCSYNPDYNGGSSDAFLAKFSPAGERIWGTYFGSIYTDDGVRCISDIHGNIYLIGTTLAHSGTVMATPGSHQPFFAGGIDSYVQKFDGCIATLPVNTTPSANLNACIGGTTTLNSSCGTWYADSLGNVPLYTGSAFTVSILHSDSTFYVDDKSCGYSVGRTPVHVKAVAASSVSITATSTSPCVGQLAMLSASGAASYTWETTGAVSPTFEFYPLLQTHYSVSATDANGCESSASIFINPSLCLGTSQHSRHSTYLNIFPNPSSGNFTVKSDSPVQLYLTDQLGREINAFLLSADNNYEAHISTLQSGVYFLRGETEKGTVYQKIIALQ